MRRIVSILLLSLMLLQAIPVLHFFSSRKAVFYTYVDEEKPEQKSKMEKDEAKEILSINYSLPATELPQPIFLDYNEPQPSSPLLEFLTPPPDGC